MRCGLAACLFSCLAGIPGYVSASDNKESLVKAAFIYNFVKFVEWPGSKAIPQQSAIDICVLGDSPMNGTGSVFKAASTPKLALSLVKEDNVGNAAAHCHVVFVSQSESGKLSEILAGLKGSPVLTVSDIEGFAERGGMIGFVMSDNKVKVVVNTKAASSNGMRVDAQLLEIALKVIDK
jgi:hypothetical protein